MNGTLTAPPMLSGLLLHFLANVVRLLQSTLSQKKLLDPQEGSVDQNGRWVVWLSIGGGSFENWLLAMVPRRSSLK